MCVCVNGCAEAEHGVLNPMHIIIIYMYICIYICMYVCMYVCIERGGERERARERERERERPHQPSGRCELEQGRRGNIPANFLSEREIGQRVMAQRLRASRKGQLRS